MHASRAERSASRLPLEFDVFANCSGGFGVRMRSIRLDVVPATSPVQPHEVASGPEANRIRAIIESGLARDRTALESLAEVMRAGNEELRYWAADALGKIGDPRAIPALVGALGDEYSAVRMSACVALGDLKARDAVAPLIRVVTGKVPSGKGYRLFIPEEVGEVRWMAARALGKIGDATAVDPLIEVLGSADGDLGLYVAQALGDLRDSRAVPALMEKARRRNEPELRGIVEALGRVGDPRARSILLELLETGKEDVRHAAAIALERMKGSPQSR